ncbi:MAG TPA: hypothetical protein VNF73_05700 [Candidatus Saccharimonadales bacterium]|nr:hypothetical protein [Candidatus Saccharimonadales bacterium]
MRREIEIIRDDLHANAVRIVGSDVGRLTAATEVALGLGLEVWFSPACFGYSPEETTTRLIAAAEVAAMLEEAHPGRVIFVAGQELTLFMPGILPGKNILATGKPVIVTEFGMRTFRGAESSGALGFGVTDGKRLALHTLPLIGRFVRPRLTGTFQRDEAMQAREVAETLDELERAGVAGALLSTFATPRAITDDDPRYDLDMDSMSLVKALPGGRHGTVYPDMPWEPKEAFAAVARHFAGH